MLSEIIIRETLILVYPISFLSNPELHVDKVEEVGHVLGAELRALGGGDLARGEPKAGGLGHGGYDRRALGHGAVAGVLQRQRGQS